MWCERKEGPFTAFGVRPMRLSTVLFEQLRTRLLGFRTAGKGIVSASVFLGHFRDWFATRI